MFTIRTLWFHHGHGCAVRATSASSAQNLTTRHRRDAAGPIHGISWLGTVLECSVLGNQVAKESASWSEKRQLFQTTTSIQFVWAPREYLKALVQGHSKVGGNSSFPPAPYQKIAGENLRLIFFEIEKKLFSKEKHFVSEFVLVIQIDSGGLSVTLFFDQSQKMLVSNFWSLPEPGLF